MKQTYHIDTINDFYKGTMQKNVILGNRNTCSAFTFIPSICRFSNIRKTFAYFHVDAKINGPIILFTIVVEKKTFKLLLEYNRNILICFQSNSV